MKQYKILVESVTGKNGNIFVADAVVNEDRFENGTVAELLKCNAIEEVIVKADKTPKADAKV